MHLIPYLQASWKVSTTGLNDGLVAHASHPISTGKLEGFNNRIKVAKRIGYGYRDEDYFFSLIQYFSIPSVKYKSPKKT